MAVTAAVGFLPACSSQPPTPGGGKAGRAAALTWAARTAGVDVDLVETFAGNSKRVHFAGSYDFRTKTGTWTTASPVASVTPATTGVGPPAPGTSAPSTLITQTETVVVTPSSFFESVPPEVAARAGGKKWFTFRFADFPGYAQYDPFTALEISLSVPEVWRTFLGATYGPTSDLGPTSVNGVPAHLFRQKVGLAQAADGSGALLPVLDKDIAFLAVDSEPIQYSIDDSGRLVQAAIAMDIPVPASATSTTSSSTLPPGSPTTSAPRHFIVVDVIITFSDFGVPVHVDVPKQSDAIDVLSVIASSTTTAAAPATTRVTASGPSTPVPSNPSSTTSPLPGLFPSRPAS